MKPAPCGWSYSAGSCAQAPAWRFAASTNTNSAHKPVQANRPATCAAIACCSVLRTKCAKRFCGPPNWAPEGAATWLLVGRGGGRGLGLGVGFGFALRIGFGCGFGFGLGFRFGVLGFRFRFRLSAGSNGLRLFAVAAVVGEVKTRTFELQRRRGNQPFQLSAAALVQRQDRIGKLLPDLKSLTTLFTTIIVKRHIACLI